MRRHTGQPAQLVGAESQHIVEAGIGAIELQGTVELPLAPGDARRELVGEPAGAFGGAPPGAGSSIGEGGARGDGAGEGHGRPAGGGWFLYSASPPAGEEGSP